MKGLQITFFVIFAGTLCIQAVRHTHLYFYGLEESILAPYEEHFGMEKEIQLEASTEELLAEYKATQERIKELSDADETKPQYELQQEHSELFARNRALFQEITEREDRQHQLRDIWLFSLAGYGLVGLGALVYSRGREWIGMSLILPGLSEVVWWSAPAFTLGGAVREYELLLVNKMILTVIALAVLLGLWLASQRKSKGL